MSRTENEQRKPRQNNQFGGRNSSDSSNSTSADGRDLTDNVIFINRVAKVVKGGRRFSFAALVAVGDKAGKVGIGTGKASEVSEAIRKAIAVARKNMFKVYLENGTIPYEVIGHFGAGRLLMKPAAQGTGVIAGGAVRSIMDVVGVQDILTKSLGTSNPNNMVHATIDALKKLTDPEEIKEIRES